jgi:hypothetical protein
VTGRSAALVLERDEDLAGAALPRPDRPFEKALVGDRGVLACEYRPPSWRAITPE